MLILIGIAEVTGAWQAFVLWLQVHVLSVAMRKYSLVAN